MFVTFLCSLELTAIHLLLCGLCKPILSERCHVIFNTEFRINRVVKRLAVTQEWSAEGIGNFLY
jgi:hypothetical protein